MSFYVYMQPFFTIFTGSFNTSSFYLFFNLIFLGFIKNEYSLKKQLNNTQ